MIRPKSIGQAHRIILQMQGEIERLRSELMTGYDLVAEAIADNRSYDFHARAKSFVKKHTASTERSKP